MSEVAGILKIIGRVFSVFILVKEGKIKRNQQVDTALEKTYEALLSTQEYVNELKTEAQDNKREMELARLWIAASIPLRHVDMELSQICGMKGSYWSQSNSWRALATGKADISLSNVERLLAELRDNR